MAQRHEFGTGEVALDASNYVAYETDTECCQTVGTHDVAASNRQRICCIGVICCLALAFTALLSQPKLVSLSINTSDATGNMTAKTVDEMSLAHLKNTTSRSATKTISGLEPPQLPIHRRNSTPDLTQLPASAGTTSAPTTSRSTRLQTSAMAPSSQHPTNDPNLQLVVNTTIAVVTNISSRTATLPPMLRPMAAAFVAIPVGTAQINECTFSGGRLNVSWTSDLPADYYEVQVANEAGGPTFAVFSTAKTEAVLDFLHAKTTYWLKVRAHNVGMPSLGPGTWAEPGTEVECKTGNNVAKRIGPRATATKTTFLEVLRQSEFTYDVDYLMNHNSGDLMGDTAFLVHGDARQPDRLGFLNTTFRKSVFTLYCVERLLVSVSDTVTTDGDNTFADFLSCDDNGNATDPICICDNMIDRKIARKNDQDTTLTNYCRISSGHLCPQTPFPKGCTCECSNASLRASAKYTGMMPVHFGQLEPLGHWYSHPKDTECAENEAVGTARADGTMCTWKRHQEARVVRGGDVLNFGWNTSSTSFHQIDPSQVRQNAALLRELFDSKPYQQWVCGDTTTDSATASTILV